MKKTILLLALLTIITMLAILFWLMPDNNHTNRIKTTENSETVLKSDNISNDVLPIDKNLNSDKVSKQQQILSHLTSMTNKNTGVKPLANVKQSFFQRISSS